MMLLFYTVSGEVLQASCPIIIFQHVYFIALHYFNSVQWIRLPNNRNCFQFYDYLPNFRNELSAVNQATELQEH